MNKQPITFEMRPKAIEHLFEELAEIKSELKRIKGSDAPKRTTMRVEEGRRGCTISGESSLYPTHSLSKGKRAVIKGWQT